MRFDAIAATIANWRGAPERISRWIAFMERIRTAESDGLGELVEDVLDGSLTNDVLLETFDRSYFEAMRVKHLPKMDNAGTQHTILRCGAPRAAPLGVPRPHPFADPRRGHARPDLVDDAGAIRMGNDPFAQGRPGQSSSPLHVGRVDPRYGDAHTNFSGRRMWIGQVAEAQDRTRRTILVIPRSLHAGLFNDRERGRPAA